MKNTKQNYLSLLEHLFIETEWGADELTNVWKKPKAIKLDDDEVNELFPFENPISITPIEETSDWDGGEERTRGVIIEVKDKKTQEAFYFCASAYYDSWNGVEWGNANIESVTKTTKTITVWE